MINNPIQGETYYRFNFSNGMVDSYQFLMYDLNNPNLFLCKVSSVSRMMPYITVVRPADLAETIEEAEAAGHATLTAKADKYLSQLDTAEKTLIFGAKLSTSLPPSSLFALESRAKFRAYQLACQKHFNVTIDENQVFTERH